jgi:hypothetical protein
MNQPQHHTSTRRVLDQYVARCSCGWESKCQDTKAQAEHEATDHVVYVTRAES